MPTSTGNTIVLRIEEKVDALFVSFNNFKNDYIGAHVKLEGEVNSVNQRVDEDCRRLEKVEARMKTLEDDLDKLADSVKPLVIQSKILGWVAIAFGGSIIALIWGLLTHTVQIVAH